MTSVAEPAPSAEQERTGAVLGELARDIARGGLAGLVAGVVVGGLGGRVVMRLATLLVPESSGGFTENGNRIGAITLEGSAALIIFVGLFAGLAAGIVWVTVSPWIPATGIRRAVLAMPIAVALSGFFLVEGDNLDFIVLRHDVLVVGSLLGLIALLGLAVALVDDVLERRLPRVDSGRSGPAFVYTVVTAIGLVFMPVIVGAYVGRPTLAPIGIALLATGAATVVWWVLRLRGAPQPPRSLLLYGRGALLVAVVLGVATLVPEVRAALLFL